MGEDGAVLFFGVFHGHCPTGDVELIPPDAILFPGELFRLKGKKLAV